MGNFFKESLAKIFLHILDTLQSWHSNQTNINFFFFFLIIKDEIKFGNECIKSRLKYVWFFKFLFLHTILAIISTERIMGHVSPKTALANQANTHFEGDWLHNTQFCIPLLHWPPGPRCAEGCQSPGLGRRQEPTRRNCLECTTNESLRYGHASSQDE